MGEASGAPTEAAKDVDGMSKRGGVSSRSPMEKIGLRRVPTARGKRATQGVVLECKREGYCQSGAGELELWVFGAR